MKQKMPNPGNRQSSILVVGAGPVGLAAGLELNRHGAELRLIDKSADRTELSKAVGINSRSLQLLEPSGVTTQLLAAGLKVRRINLRDGDEVLTQVDFSKLQGPYKFLLSLPQADTERILETALLQRGISVERQTELLGLTQNSDGIEARLSYDGNQMDHSADYILGCDGAHSTVRKALGLEFDGERYPETWSLADVRMNWAFGHGEGNLFMRTDGLVLFVISLPCNRYRVIANVPEALSLLPPRSHITEILWQTNFSVSLRQVRSYVGGRAYLAGDAAHIHSPAGGRGMNLGIEDACEFARCLTEGELQAYAADRHRVGQQVVRESDLQFRMAKVANPFLISLRNCLMRGLFSSEFIQSRFRRRMAGLQAVP